MKTKKLDIFLVDDNIMYLNLLEHFFYKCIGTKGYSLKSFSSGEACLKEVKRSSPHIVVLDYYLNSTMANAENGTNILRKIKSLNRNAQVIMLSSQEKIDVATNSLKLGASDYVIKNESAFEHLEIIVKKVCKTILLKDNIKKLKIRNTIILIIYFILVIALGIYAKRDHWEF